VISRRTLLNAARRNARPANAYRCLGRFCDYCTQYARYTILASGRPAAAACLLHLACAVIDAHRDHAEAEVVVGEWREVTGIVKVVKRPARSV
jgi:hypothetical protein